MRRSLAILLLTSGLACNRQPKPKAAPPPPPVVAQDPVDWRALSADAKGEIRQLNLADATCRVEGVLNGAVIWSTKECLSTANQLHFASNDAERLVVIDPMPEIPNGKWGAAVAVAGFQRGMLVHSNALGKLVRDATKLRMTQRYVRWLQGTSDIAGVPPGRTEDGAAIRLETVDGARFDVRFDHAEGALLPVAPPETGSSMRTMYEYGDGQFAESMAEVPKKFKRTAKKVQMRTVTPVASPGATLKK